MWLSQANLLIKNKLNRLTHLASEVLGKAKIRIRYFLWNVCRLLRLIRFDRVSPEISLHKDDLLLFCCVRNELVRLPFFLDYYRSKGVARFFFIDNDSSDGTLEFLLSQKNDVCVYQTRDSYANARYGIFWFKYLLDQYGYGKWCLLIDSDEILIYPRWEETSLKGLCHFFTSEHRTGFKADLLDMYGKGLPPLQISLSRPLWEVFPYFDTPRSPHFFTIPPGKKFFGGVRKRVFDVSACLEKIPLFKYGRAVDILVGIHDVSGVDLSSIHGALLHFKFDSLFLERAKSEANRLEHWRGALEYKRYVEVASQWKDASLYSDEYSVLFKNSEQLLDLGIMQSTDAFTHYVF